LFAHVSQTGAPTHKKEIDDLTERELDVLRLLASGSSNSEIARRLFLSEGTIRNYLSTIFNKLGVADRTQAALIAIQAGITLESSQNNQSDRY
jgi:DNA-binding NarL/FixJ family response regulator